MPPGLYQIERILDGPDDNDRFLIKWEWYADADNNWEPRGNLPDSVLEEYLGVDGRREGESDTSSSSSVENLSRRRRAGKRARREPGVNVAQVVDPSSAQGREPVNPPRLAKGMGILLSVVHVCGRFLHPITSLRAQDPNNYWRVKVYQMVVTGWGREVIKKERAYVLLLEPGSRHDGEALGGKFFCRFVHADR
jgi:hypothetical protein